MITFLGTAQNNKTVVFYYVHQEGDYTFLKVAYSYNGLTIDTKSNYAFVFTPKQREEQNFNWQSARIAKEGRNYILTHKYANGKDKRLYSAFSSNLSVWETFGAIEGIHETGAVVPQYLHNDAFVMYVGEKNISLAYSQDLTSWKAEKGTLLSPRKGNFDDVPLEVGNAYKLNDKILLLYYVKKPDNYSVGAAYFDAQDPAKLLWRSEEPVYELPRTVEQETVSPLGSAVIHDQLILYWKAESKAFFATICPIPTIRKQTKKEVFSVLVKKHPKNPILAPRPHIPWDSRASFNSAAVYEDGKVHFLYRALGDTDLSVLGYATSSDGLTIDYRADMPAYIPREPFETPGNFAFSNLAQHFVSGGGYGGVEDPRITRVEDKMYLTYVAFDGATPPRAALSSIDVEDFIKNNWDKWAKPKLISAPGMVNKSAVILPNKVNGKYVVLHRVYPNILVDYLDDLEFNNYLRGDYFIPPRKNFWDSKKVGAGAPPMETKDGWLLIYQSVGHQDPSRYKIGAMMLDKNKPEKVLYRTSMPIIEPIEPYENNGLKAGVVYPCGAVILKDKLFIYYGGADSYVNAASADLATFLDEMKHHKEPTLQKVHISG